MSSIELYAPPHCSHPFNPMNNPACCPSPSITLSASCLALRNFSSLLVSSLRLVLVAPFCFCFCIFSFLGEQKEKPFQEHSQQPASTEEKKQLARMTTSSCCLFSCTVLVNDKIIKSPYSSRSIALDL